VTLAVVTAVVGSAAPAAGSDADARIPHVRSDIPQIANAIQDATAGSATFRRLI